MNVSRLFLAHVLSLIPFIGGCSLLTGDDGMFRAREKDYLRSGVVEPMKVPEGMETASLETQFNVPDVNAKDEFGDPVQVTEYLIPRPVPVSEDDEELGVKIQSLDNRRWIFLNVPTSQVWPQTQSFLSEYKILPLKSEPAKGLVESDWVGFKDDPQMRSRFKISIEKGVHPDTTEVHVLQVQYPADSLPSVQQNVHWPERSHDPEREKWLLDAMAIALSESVSNSAASLMGQHVGGREKVALTRYNNEPALSLNLSRVRANASIVHAVQADGFVEYESSGEKGVFYFGYPYFKEEKPGMFDKMAFWKNSDQTPAKSVYPLKTILSHLSDAPEAITAFSGVADAKAGKPLDGAPGYLIVLRPSLDGMIAVVRDVNGERLTDSKSKEILRLLRTRLI